MSNNTQLARREQKDMQNQWQPANFAEAQQLAELVAQSGFAPKEYRGKPQDCLMAMMAGNEVGLGPMASLQNIAVINGRPSIWGDAALALVKSSPDFEWIKEWIDDQKGAAVCKVKRKGEDPVERTFSWDDAQRAGLTKKDGPWKTYPKRMLQMRARSWAIRDVWPHVLKGLSIDEESSDAPPRDVSPGQTEESEQPQTDPLQDFRDSLSEELASAVAEGLITEENKQQVEETAKSYTTEGVLSRYRDKIREHLDSLRQSRDEQTEQEEPPQEEAQEEEESYNPAEDGQDDLF
jgi:hypothetical protein